jgi:hypothetical protein
MADDPDALSFRISNESLTKAIEILLERGGLAQYPAEYQALVLERSRRELLSPSRDIQLPRDDFDSLPQAVQHLLMLAGAAGETVSHRGACGLGICHRESGR